MKNDNFFIRRSLLYLPLVVLMACSSDDSAGVGFEFPDNQGFQGEVEWVKTFGGSMEDNALSVVETTDGGFAAAGYTLSNDGDILDKTTTDSDFWVLRLTKDGQIAWSKTYGGTRSDRAEKIIQSSDGGFVLVGNSRSNDEDVSSNAGLQDYWIVKINSAGDILWEKSTGFVGIDRAFSVTETQDGGYFVSGFLDVTSSQGAGNDNGEATSRSLVNAERRHGVGDFWGIKLDASGKVKWRRYFGGNNNDRSYDAIQTEDNGFLMIGSTESTDVDISNNNGSYDFWIVKINAEGAMIWEKTYGGSEIDVGYAIAATGNGKYVIIGDARSNDGNISNAKGNADLWMLQIDANGNLLWERSVGGSGFDTGRGIQKLKDGGFVITGNSRSNDFDLQDNKGESDVWTLKISDSGATTWNATLGGSGSEFGNGCIETADDKLVVVGSSDSRDFDVPSNRGSKDVIVIKYK